MSAAEVIEEIKKLPAQEQEKVFAFLSQQPREPVVGTPPVRYMDTDKAKAASAQVFAEHAELFRKLAQ